MIAEHALQKRVFGVPTVTEAAAGALQQVTPAMALLPLYLLHIRLLLQPQQLQILLVPTVQKFLTVQNVRL